jgi:hypothetical protein
VQGTPGPAARSRPSILGSRRPRHSSLLAGRELRRPKREAGLKSLCTIGGRSVHSDERRHGDRARLRVDHEVAVPEASRQRFA